MYHLGIAQSTSAKQAVQVNDRRAFIGDALRVRVAVPGAAVDAAERAGDALAARLPGGRRAQLAVSRASPRSRTVTAPGPATFTVDRALVRELKDREDARFRDEHRHCIEFLERGRRVMPNGVPMAWHVGSYHHPPLWSVEGKGAHFTDADGHTYADFNIADMSMFCGYAPEPLVRAVCECMARGHQFLLPCEDAIIVSEELGRRYDLP
jgi:hypothetical protein